MIEHVEALLRRAAAEAVLPYFQRLAAHEIAEKTSGEWVTAADHASERLIADGLRALLPGSVVVGEEAVAADPSLLDALGRAGTVWVVDPLDGTRNFIGGHGPVSIMTALLRDGEVEAACMLDALSGVAATAERGAGARYDGRAIRAPDDAPPVAAMRGAIFSRFLPPDVKERVLAGAGALAEALPGSYCAGYEYPAIALGMQHFALWWRTLPWDHLPGAFFLEEAGGVAAGRQPLPSW